MNNAPRFTNRFPVNTFNGTKAAYFLCCRTFNGLKQVKLVLKIRHVLSITRMAFCSFNKSTVSFSLQNHNVIVRLKLKQSATFHVSGFYSNSCNCKFPSLYPTDDRSFASCQGDRRCKVAQKANATVTVPF